MAPRLSPLYAFDDPAEYHRRHSAGVLQEFENQSKEIRAFNERQSRYKSWVLVSLHRGKTVSYWVFLVRPGESGAEILFPREGESCELLLWSKSGKVQRSEKYWEAERIENPAASFGVTQDDVLRMPAFKVKVPSNIPKDFLRPLQDDPAYVGQNAPNHLAKQYAFVDKKAVMVTMKLRISSATKDAELGAIEKLFKNKDNDLTDKQKAAFKYLLNFQDIPFTVNLFQHFPHLRDPINNPGGMPPKVVTVLKGFNAHQRIAYKNVLRALPCGICIIPGGPGAGKTHWNLVLTAAIQSKNVVFHSPENLSNQSAKILYLLDINKPLDDTCNKIIRLYKSLGLKKHAIRLYGWPYSSKTKGEAIDFSQKFMFMARMNRFRRKTFKETCLAPTLDEFVWDNYQAHKDDRYRELHNMVSAALKSKKDPNAENMKKLVGQLYREVLSQIDFIATTPVPAATRFNGLFKPDIVIFDESPHAREASTMIAIAQYEPIAWIFSGDHRQTRPFIASDDTVDNPWAPQMLVPMMERADRQGAIRHSLLINHRAYGGLQQLASRMFYRNEMISGHTEEKMFPPSVSHIQKFLDRFLDPESRRLTQEFREPRLLAFDGNRSECRVGTSWFNPRHIDWVMQRVSELLPDPMFCQVDKDTRGTILIVSPYKESYMRYKKAIKDLPASWQTRLNVQGRVEARTVDTVQGGEADFVFLDFVRSEASPFLDDPNRLNVALTRARQGEIIMMHPGMRRYTLYLAQVFKHCESMGHVVEINQRAPRLMASAPNAIQAYQQHMEYRRRFDGERVAFGLQPNGSEDSEGPKQSAEHSEDLLQEDGDLESIFTAQIAGLAGMMERILAGKKANELTGYIRKTARHRGYPTREHTHLPHTAAPTTLRLTNAAASASPALEQPSTVQSRSFGPSSSTPFKTDPNGQHDTGNDVSQSDVVSSAPPPSTSSYSWW